MIKEYSTYSAKETEEFARKIGVNLNGGECIEFSSDLGGGKTTFVKGLVDGCGTNDNVSSPTFTISKRYKCTKFSIYHYDFYRLQEPGLVAEELADSLTDKSNVILVEWANSVVDVLPSCRVKIIIRKSTNNPEERLLNFEYPNSLDYLFKEVG